MIFKITSFCELQAQIEDSDYKIEDSDYKKILRKAYDKTFHSLPIKITFP